MTKEKQIKNGDVFDIGQTVNGVSKFLWLNNTWYYFEERLSREYEYDQSDLTKLVLENEFEEVTFIKNIFDTTNINILAVNHLPLGSTLEGK
jgi:hypothetical protein